MADQESLETRITKLEEACAHQQHLLEELNQVIIDLRVQVDTVALQCSQLASRIESVEQSASTIDDRPEKPPHY